MMTPKQIKAWRKAMGLTQRKAAEALGISVRPFQEMEAGYRYKLVDGVAPKAPIDKRTELACKYLLLKHKEAKT